ncbi:complement regulator-acquiring protein [Borreliella garinii]|uniref:complement regulator-acquiring protein n=1 Tax=Borreliella garinii TaxID=29519 RepID=UPI001AEEDA41|nr:complement regulator-acquiring protein [Borreliella garinii]
MLFDTIFYRFLTSIPNIRLVVEKTLMNRIIYLSLNYEIQKIEILKEILEKLNKNPMKKFSTQSFLNQMVLNIQFQLDKH